jgi:signal peptide peptidase-like protein 2B
MAVSLALNALSHYRLSTYKTITIILVLFFVYDVFMVFVTPTFTNGTSIMEAVAFGGKEAADSIRAQVSQYIKI